MDAFISSDWRTARAAEYFIGGMWRKLTRAEVYRDGSWRRCLSFADPLSVLAYDVDGVQSSRRPTTVISGLTQATPVGGQGPFSYQWTITDGRAVADTPSNARTSFRAIVAPEEVDISTARVICTDALGATATADITITLSNDGTF